METDESSSKQGSATYDYKVTQLTINETAAKVVPFLLGSIRHERLLEATMTFITQSLQPMSVADEPSFRNLLKVAEPRYKLPHQTHFTDKVIPAKYKAVQAGIEKKLAKVKHCVVTTDFWTAQYQQRAYISYLSLLTLWI